MTNKITTIGIVIGLLFLGVTQLISSGSLSREVSSLGDKVATLQGNIVVLSASQQALGAASGPAHYQHESFLQGLSAGPRDEFTVTNAGALTAGGNITGEGESTLFGDAASSTVQIGAASKSGCIILGDSANGGDVVYITASGATLTAATTTKPAACQTAQ